MVTRDPGIAGPDELPVRLTGSWSSAERRTYRAPDEGLDPERRVTGRVKATDVYVTVVDRTWTGAFICDEPLCGLLFVGTATEVAWIKSPPPARELSFILGVHEIKPRPAVVDGAIVARELGNLSLSLDHRVVDGAVGADFLYALIERLQHPAAWLGEGDVA